MVQKYNWHTKRTLAQNWIRQVSYASNTLSGQPFYGRAVDNKIMVAINTIGAQQASDTEATNDAVHQLLDYLATYPDVGILYQASDMILTAHSDAGFHN